MKDELIKFDTAVIAKKKGFNVITKYHYDTFKDLCSGDSNTNWNLSKVMLTSAPTQTLLQRWLREEHKLVVQVTLFPTEGYVTDIIHTDDRESILATFTDYDVWEEALEIGLEEALKLIKSK